MSIELFKYYVHKILPLVYDDSLSYYEVLAKVIAKLNEVITEQNNGSQEIDEMKEAIESFIESQNEVIEDMEQRLDNGLQEITEGVDEVIDSAIADMNKAYSEIESDNEEFKESIQSEISSFVTGSYSPVLLSYRKGSNASFYDRTIASNGVKAADGLAVVQEIHGKTYMLSQLIENGDNASASGAVASWNNEHLSASGTDYRINSDYTTPIYQNITLMKDHTYIVIFDYWKSSAWTSPSNVTIYGDPNTTFNETLVSTRYGEWERLAKKFVCTENNSSKFYINQNASEPGGGYTILLKNIQLFDITENASITEEEFANRYNQDYYDNNTKYINFIGTKINGVDLPTLDIFENGMNDVNGIHDSIYMNNAQILISHTMNKKRERCSVADFPITGWVADDGVYKYTGLTALINKSNSQRIKTSCLAWKSLATLRSEGNGISNDNDGNIYIDAITYNNISYFANEKIIYANLNNEQNATVEPVIYPINSAGNETLTSENSVEFNGVVNYGMTNSSIRASLS